MDSWTDTTKHALFRKTGLFQSEAALLVQIFPWETEFMNNALWSPRGARAGDGTVAGTAPQVRWVHRLTSSLPPPSPRNPRK